MRIPSTLSASFCLIFICAPFLSGGDIKIIDVAASSVENNRPEMRGENAVDGNVETRWASVWEDPQWIRCDMGEPKLFNKVTILWEAAYAKSYEIQVSNDGKNWKAIYEEKNGDGGTDSIVVGNQKARYVRMYGTFRGTQWGYSILEFTVGYEMKDDGRQPSVPAEFSAVFADKMVFLNWQENKDADFNFFNVYRSQNGNKKFVKLNEKPLKISQYRDEAIASGVSYSYYVTAVDYPGHESRPSPKASGIPSAPKKRNYFSVPACAWKRYVGDIPVKCESSSPNRGVAIGGFGAGSFMYTLCGSFGPFQTFDSTLYKNLWLPEAAFHLYEKIGAGSPRVRCLATDSRLKSAWDKIKIGDGIYYGLQPKGWATYHCFNVDVSQKFFSPILPNNYKETSYPVGIWQFRFYNPTKENADVSLMLTFPAVYAGENIKEDKFKNSVVVENGMTGLVMKSEKGIGEWCIASKESDGAVLSYVTSWNGSGNGGDIWKKFKDDGILGGLQDISNGACAMAVKVRLKPGEEKTVPLVISWDFPVVKFNSGTEWWKKYTEYFGRGGDKSFAVAREALQNYRSWEKKMDAWMEPVIRSGRYPDWLKCAAFNELYYNQFGGIFYESGLKSGHKEEFMGLHPEDHKHFEMESPVYTSANTLDVRHYSSIIFAKFWPEIERDTLKCFADGTLLYQFPKPVPKGLVPHDVGDPRKCDPYFKFDVYRQDIPDLLYWKDLSSKYLQQCWRYYYLYKDKDFLNYVWPACKAAFNFLKSTDKDGDGLPDNSGSDNTYDSWGLYGTSLLCGALWVGALESLEKMAAIQNDPILSGVREVLSKAKKNLDSELWIAGKGYYRIDTQGKCPTAIMSDGLNGQLYCSRYGLDAVLPKEKIKMHLAQVFERCVKPMKDYTGDRVGDIGAINAIKEDGGLIGTLQSDEIWTGSSYFLAALMDQFGLKEEALKTAYGVYYTTYENPETAFWFNTPESWRVHTMKARPSGPEQYQRPRAVWELLLSIEDPYSGSKEMKQ